MTGRLLWGLPTGVWTAPYPSSCASLIPRADLFTSFQDRKIGMLGQLGAVWNWTKIVCFPSAWYEYGLSKSSSFWKIFFFLHIWMVMEDIVPWIWRQLLSDSSFVQYSLRTSVNLQFIVCRLICMSGNRVFLDWGILVTGLIFKDFQPFQHLLQINKNKPGLIVYSQCVKLYVM